MKTAIKAHKNHALRLEVAQALRTTRWPVVLR